MEKNKLFWHNVIQKWCQCYNNSMALLHNIFNHLKIFAITRRSSATEFWSSALTEPCLAFEACFYIYLAFLLAGELLQKRQNFFVELGKLGPETDEEFAKISSSSTNFHPGVLVSSKSWMKMQQYLFQWRHLSNKWKIIGNRLWLCAQQERICQTFVIMECPHSFYSLPVFTLVAHEWRAGLDQFYGCVVLGHKLWL